MNSGNMIDEEKMKQNKSKVNFENLKSNYILKKIFDNLKKINSLKITKTNKNLQKRLNLSINDYKEYSQLYSSIEIELKIIDDKYDKFINIPDEETEFFHIYFEGANEEIKINYLKENEKENIIRIIINYPVISFKELFKNCKYVSSIYFKKFYRININDMSFMFYGCSSLEELNLSNLITNRVIYMNSMFSECSKLKELNISNFNTDNVINMRNMFSDCSSLKELNISNFTTNNVTDMSFMFSRCSKLKELNLSSFITNNLTDMNTMFYGCSSLNELNLEKFNSFKDEQ